MQDPVADLLWGAQAIGDCIGRSYRQTIHLLTTDKIPATKVGAIWVGSRSKLLARLRGDDASNGGA